MSDYGRDSESAAPSIEMGEATEISGKEGKALEAEGRRENREAVGRAVVKRYLEVSEKDDPARRELKERVAGLNLPSTIGEVLGTQTPEEAMEVLDKLGIASSEVKSRKGKEQRRWRLRNPGDKSLPGSFANEEHLRAFVVGFAGAENFREQVRVIREVYEYIGLQPPAMEELLPPDEEMEELTTADVIFEEAPEAVPEAARPEAVPEAAPVTARTAESAPETAAPAEEKEPEEEKKPSVAKPPRTPVIPLSRWKKVMHRLEKTGRAATLAIGLISAFGNVRSHGAEAAEVRPDEVGFVSLETPEPAPAPAPAETAPAPQPAETVAPKETPPETTLYRLRAGDNVESVCRHILGKFAKDDAVLRHVVQEVLRANDIGDKGYAVSGDFDSRHLSIGTVIDVSHATQKLHELQQISQLKAGM